MTGPIADLLTRIRNAELAKHKATVVPFSIEKESMLKVMEKHGYVKSFEVKKIADKVFKEILVELDPLKAHRTYYKRISKPGQRIYKHSEQIKAVKNGLGISIISTSHGIMSNVEAKKLKIGGEVLCEIW